MRTAELAVCLSLATIGCGDDEVDNVVENAELTTREVARVTRSDGSSWRFLEPEPGELFLWSVFPDTAPTARDEQDFGSLSYVEIYQRLTSDPVPLELREAQARVDAQAHDTDPSPDDGGLANEAGGSSREDNAPAISATAFQNEYCWENYDYLYCWPVFYGSPFVQRKVYAMDGYVAAVNTTVDFRFRYKKHASSSWKTVVSGQALPGQVHHGYSHFWSYRRWRRWEVLDNGDNLVRYSAMGED